MTIMAICSRSLLSSSSRALILRRAATSGVGLAGVTSANGASGMDISGHAECPNERELEDSEEMEHDIIWRFARAAVRVTARIDADLVLPRLGAVCALKHDIHHTPYGVKQ